MAGLVPPSTVKMPEQSNVLPFKPMDVNVPTDQTNILVDPNTGSITVFNEDGSADVDLDPQNPGKPKSTKFDDNLAEHMSDNERALVASEILEGIEQDIESRREWVAIYNKAIDLLGLKLEEASSEVGSFGTVSKVYHPLLLEAVVRSQANARAELLPANGPVKIRDDEPMGYQERVESAEAMEKDFNHYLTAVAKEYYPDTDKMFFSMFLCGNGFKKVYHCPLRRRPVSDSVSPQDLIVSNEAVDLFTAIRVTHRIYMNQSTMKRMQISGQYRKPRLMDPQETQDNLSEIHIKNVEGIQTTTKLPQDHRYEIYEAYVEYDLPGFEHKEGLPLPYRITIDKDSRDILEIRRNWKEGDEDYRARRRFVKYSVIPGLGFYDYGYMHLLGNTTRALTAIERQLLDAGQFNNFPGFLISKQGQRQTTTQIRVPPGGAHEIDTGGMPIQDVAMALPYKGASATLAEIAEKIAEDGRRLGSTNEIQVGEGRADVPVGTTIALIEQATKVIAVVHKRLHSAQQEEFELMKELFAEDPTSLWRFAKNPARKWQQESEFSDLEFVPAADPNIPSHIHRVMQATALVQLSQAAPQIYNMQAVHERALRTLGIQDADSLFTPPQQPGQGIPPEMMLKQQELQLKAAEQQRTAQQALAEIHTRMVELQANLQNDEADRQSKKEIEALKLQEQRIREQMKTHNDNMMELHKMGLQHAQDRHMAGLQHNQDQQMSGLQHNQAQQMAGLQHAAEMHKSDQDRQFQADQAQQSNAMEMHKINSANAIKEKQAKKKPKPKGE